MNLKAVVAASSLAILVGVYGIGVYITGKSFDEELAKAQDKINVYLNEKKGINESLTDLNVKFVVNESGFTKRQFDAVLKLNDKEEVTLPMTSSLGFLSAEVVANKISDNDIATLQKYIDATNIALDLSKIDMTSKAKFSAMQDGFTYESKISHVHDLNVFDIKIEGDAGNDINNYVLTINNYKDKYIKFKDMIIKGESKAIQKGSDLGSHNLHAKRILINDPKSPLLIDNLSIDAITSKVSEDGMFNVKFQVKSNEFIQNLKVDLDVDLEGLNISTLEGISSLYDFSLPENERNDKAYNLLNNFLGELYTFNINKFTVDANAKQVFGSGVKALYSQEFVPLDIKGKIISRMTPVLLFDPTTKFDFYVTTSPEAGSLFNKSQRYVEFKEEGSVSKTHVLFEKGRFEKENASANASYDPHAQNSKTIPEELLDQKAKTDVKAESTSNTETKPDPDAKVEAQSEPDTKTDK